MEPANSIDEIRRWCTSNLSNRHQVRAGLPGLYGQSAPRPRQTHKAAVYMVKNRGVGGSTYDADDYGMSSIRNNGCRLVREL